MTIHRDVRSELLDECYAVWAGGDSQHPGSYSLGKLNRDVPDAAARAKIISVWSFCR